MVASGGWRKLESQVNKTMNLSGICRTKEIRGYAFPGVIHNDSYFLSDLKVFADGLIDCWGMVVLPLFKGKLDSDWVVTSIPDGKPLDIQHLGSLLFSDAAWTHTNESLCLFIEEIIADLNPRMENLYNCHDRETEKVGRIRCATVSTGNPRPWKPIGSIAPIMIGRFGRSLQHFRVSEDQLFLTTIQLFDDDKVVIFGTGDPITMEFSEFAAELRDPNCFRLPNSGDRVTIEHLVTFTVDNWRWCINSQSIEEEFHDIHNQIQGRPGSIQLCCNAFADYLTEQSKDNFKQLKEKYEAVPEHLRKYCGDMDSQDIPIRMVLYGKDEIDNWSHYQVSKAIDMDPPSIDLP